VHLHILTASLPSVCSHQAPYMNIHTHTHLSLSPSLSLSLVCVCERVCIMNVHIHSYMHIGTHTQTHTNRSHSLHQSVSSDEALQIQPIPAAPHQRIDGLCAAGDKLAHHLLPFHLHLLGARDQHFRAACQTRAGSCGDTGGNTFQKLYIIHLIHFRSYFLPMWALHSAGTRALTFENVRF